MPPLPRSLLLAAVLVLPVVLVACGDGDDDPDLLADTVFEMNRTDGAPEEVDSYGELEEAVEFEVPLPLELPLDMSVQRVLATPEGTPKLGALLQFFMNAPGTTTASTLTVMGSPRGTPRQVAPVEISEGIEGYFTASAEDPGAQNWVLEWESCDLAYAYQAPPSMESNDVLSIARAFAEACEA